MAEELIFSNVYFCIILYKFESLLAAEVNIRQSDNCLTHQEAIMLAEEVKKRPEFANTSIATRDTFSSTWWRNFCKSYDLITETHQGRKLNAISSEHNDPDIEKEYMVKTSLWYSANI